MTEGADVWSMPIWVRFDEAGPDGMVRTSTLLRYAQALASLHSAARGFDRAWYAERGLTWLARTAAVATLVPIAHGSSLTGSTHVVGERRVWARRRTEFHDEAGDLVAWAHVDWVLLDGRGAPTRIPPEFDGPFGMPRATFPLGRVVLGSPPAEAGTIRFAVRPQELDPMDHVNNAVYADWLDEAILAAGDMASVRATPRLVRLEYARPAEPSASLTATFWRDGGGWAYRLADDDGTELLRAHVAPMTGDAESGYADPGEPPE